MVTRNDNGAGQDLARLCDVRAQKTRSSKAETASAMAAGAHFYYAAHYYCKR